MVTMNAIIESVDICYARGFILEANVAFKLPSGCQSYGGYVLGKKDDKEPAQNAFGIECINRIMSTVGAESWSGLEGMPCRVIKEDSMGKIQAMGNFLDDKWFSFQETADELINEEEKKAE